MSYEIEYLKKAYKSKNKYGDDVYFTYVMTCSNNVFPRTPHPAFVAHGRGWEVIQKICGIAADCESGCWKPLNRWVSPESYIRRWRKVLKEAPPLENFAPGQLSLKLTMKQQELKTMLEFPEIPGEPNKHYIKRGKELLKEINLPLVEAKWFDETHTTLKVPIETYADVERVMELQNCLKNLNLLCWNIGVEFF
jgi:hypothetical protein